MIHIKKLPLFLISTLLFAQITLGQHFHLDNDESHVYCNLCSFSQISDHFISSDPISVSIEAGITNYYIYTGILFRPVTQIHFLSRAPPYSA